MWTPRRWVVLALVATLAACGEDRGVGDPLEMADSITANTPDVDLGQSRTVDTVANTEASDTVAR